MLLPQSAIKLSFHPQGSSWTFVDNDPPSPPVFCSSSGQGWETESATKGLLHSAVATKPLRVCGHCGPMISGPGCSWCQPGCQDGVVYTRGQRLPEKHEGPSSGQREELLL